MKTFPLVSALALAVVLPSAGLADPINPAVSTLKDWLLYPGPDGLHNGMRKSISYYSASHSFSGATVTYSVEQSSAIARTLKFLSEYYLTYQGDLNSSQKLGLYNQIKAYAKRILQHRKYATGWGWTFTLESDLVDANLETGKFYHGAVATASTYTMFTGLGNAFACEALVAASRVAEARGDTTYKTTWRNAAKLIGDFLVRLSDPYDYYKTTFNADVMVDNANTPIKKVGLVFDLVTSQEKLLAYAPLQNLYAIVALKDLRDATGIQSYYTAAIKIRDQMCPGLFDFFHAFHAKFNANGSGKVDTSAEFATGYHDNDWHAIREDTSNPQVGDDNIEYALAALWQFHDMSALNYEFLFNNNQDVFNMIDRATPFHMAAVKNFPDFEYYIAFTGYFQWHSGAWKHQMPYYDMVGFGLLGELRRGIMYADYVEGWKKVIKAKIDTGKQADLPFTMATKDIDAYWTSTHEASKSTLVSVAIGLSLMKITPYYSGTTLP